MKVSLNTNKFLIIFKLSQTNSKIIQIQIGETHIYLTTLIKTFIKSINIYNYDVKYKINF